MTVAVPESTFMAMCSPRKTIEMIAVARCRPWKKTLWPIFRKKRSVATRPHMTVSESATSVTTPAKKLRNAKT
jgi:hypothetical protein